MNAKEQAIQYAASHNDGAIYTNQEFFGMMFLSGAVISRTTNSKVVANARKENGALVVTETTITTTHEIVNGKVIDHEEKNTVEIFRAVL